MQSGTAIGLMVGGAVLILAAAPRRTVSPGGVVQPAAGGALNPFNWNLFNGGGNAGNPAGIFGQQAQPQAVQPNGYSPNYNGAGFQDAGYTPAASAGGYTPAAFYGDVAPTTYNTAAQGGMGTPMAFNYPVMTPSGGFQSAAYMAPGPAGTGYQPQAEYAANSSPAYSTAANWA